VLSARGVQVEKVVSHHSHSASLKSYVSAKVADETNRGHMICTWGVQVEKVVFQLVCDPDGVVVDEALHTLVPAFVAWSISRKHPFGQVLRAVLSACAPRSRSAPSCWGAPSPGRARAACGHWVEREKWNFGVLLRMLTGLLEEVRSLGWKGE